MSRLLTLTITCLALMLNPSLVLAGSVTPQKVAEVGPPVSRIGTVLIRPVICAGGGCPPGGVAYVLPNPGQAAQFEISLAGSIPNNARILGAWLSGFNGGERLQYVSMIEVGVKDAKTVLLKASGSNPGFNVTFDVVVLWAGR